MLLTKGGSCSCVSTLSAIGCGCIFHDGAPGRRKGRAARLQAPSNNAREARDVPSQKRETAVGHPFFFFFFLRKAVFLPTCKVVNPDFMFPVYGRLLSSSLSSAGQRHVSQ